jgi:hypothetical protein
MIRAEVKTRLEEMLANLNGEYDEQCVYTVLGTLHLAMLMGKVPECAAFIARFGDWIMEVGEAEMEERRK